MDKVQMLSFRFLTAKARKAKLVKKHVLMLRDLPKTVAGSYLWFRW